MKKLFILGCPRSGTTMVQQALNRHSRIAIPPETKFFFSFFGCSLQHQVRHVERLNADLGIRLSPPAARVSSAAEGRAFYEAMAGQYVERLGKKGLVYFGEKTPEHTGHLPRIRQLFPDAKILVLYRDGRDVAVSLSKMPWMTPDLYVNFMVWLYYCGVVRQATTNPGPNLHFARYEDIVADPEQELGTILRFLDLPYEPAVAQGCGNKEGIPEREYGWKARALQKITTERVGVFRSELSTAEVEILERLGRQALPSLGYPLVTDGLKPLPLGFLLKLSYNMSKFVYRLPRYSVVQELMGLSFLYRSRGRSAGFCFPAAT
jgi:hypothetical protein